MILPLTPEQRAALRRGERVTVRVRMEPQPVHRHGRVYKYRDTIGNMLAIVKNHNPLGPPGTRHATDQTWRDDCIHSPGMSCSSDHRCFGRMVETNFVTTATDARAVHDGEWFFEAEVEAC